MSTSDPGKHYLWCDPCRRSFAVSDAPNNACPVCGTDLHAMGKFNALLRGLMANELVASDLRTKHRQLVRLVWTRNGMGEQYYRVLSPNMPYNRFEARVTDILCAGAEEGWVRFVFPPAPSTNDNAYRLEFVDEARFVAALEALTESVGQAK